MLRKKSFIHFFLILLLCQSAGIIGSLFSIPAIRDWYQFLVKPAFSPPNWIFAPVWITLYTIMAIAFFLIWKSPENKNKRTATITFFVQLYFNAIWSLIFFGLRNPFLAFIDIILLEVAILLTLFYFLRLNKIAGALLIPYLFWVSYASMLNFFIWQLNL